MDKTKSKLAAFFDNDEEDTSFLQKPVDDLKLSQYTAGNVRKSRREKEQEAAEAKKREEEASAAQAYAEFLDAFEGEEVSKRKGSSAFVRAESNTAYFPSVAPVERHQRPRSPSPTASGPVKPKGKRAMDSFLEEIKKEQAEREAKYSRHGHGRSVTAMAAYDGQSGSKDRGDPQTTNLFVANLPVSVTEPGLGKFFARAGPVGSVKVMWPRSDIPIPSAVDPSANRRPKGTGLNGFVSFMTRRDAEEALRQFDGYDWGGSILRVGWSKAVPIAAKPLYVSTSSKPHHSRSRSRSPSRSYSPDRHRVRESHHRSQRSRSPSWDRNRSRSPRRRGSYSRSRRYDSSDSRSPRRGYSRSPPHAPADDGEAVTDTFIRAVAAEVKGHDKKFEETLREREKSNPKYNFLLRRDHRRHAYYRGLIESEEPFKPAFDDEGYNSVYSSDSAEESEREQTKKNALGTAARQRFEAMLRALSGKRGEIARSMTFSLEHAEAAHEVADIIVSSLLVDGTAVPRKVARLHLICDILHNSAASLPSAWKYRQEFQARLGIVFDHLANIYHSFPGRITADLFKKQIITIVDIWEDLIVFPPEFTSELRTRLEGAVVSPDNAVEEKPAAQPAVAEANPSRFKTSFKSNTFRLASETKPSEQESSRISDGEPMDVSSDEDKAVDNDHDGEPIESLDIDGIPVEDIDGEPTGGHDIDGIPVDDIDGEPVDNIDGEPMDDTAQDIDDLDGEPIADDIDGLAVGDGAFLETQHA